jgi:hypothetical protein
MVQVLVLFIMTHASGQQQVSQPERLRWIIAVVVQGILFALLALIARFAAFAELGEARLIVANSRGARPTARADSVCARLARILNRAGVFLWRMLWRRPAASPPRYASNGAPGGLSPHRFTPQRLWSSVGGLGGWLRRSLGEALGLLRWLLAVVCAGLELSAPPQASIGLAIVVALAVIGPCPPPDEPVLELERPAQPPAAPTPPTPAPQPPAKPQPSPKSPQAQVVSNVIFPSAPAPASASLPETLHPHDAEPSSPTVPPRRAHATPSQHLSQSRPAAAPIVVALMHRRASPFRRAVKPTSHFALPPSSLPRAWLPSALQAQGGDGARAAPPAAEAGAPPSSSP